MKKLFDISSVRKIEHAQDKEERRHSEDKKSSLSYPMKAFYQGEICGRNPFIATRVRANKFPVRFVNFASSRLTRGEMRGLQLKQKSPNKRKIFDTKIINQRFKEIDKMYSLRRPEVIKSFLSNNDLLLLKISNTYKKIREQFPSENIFLEVYSSPTYHEEKEVLISVSTSMSPKDAIERLDKVDDELWFEDSNESFINICLKLEYQ